MSNRKRAQAPAKSRPTAPVAPSDVTVIETGELPDFGGLPPIVFPVNLSGSQALDMLDDALAHRAIAERDVWRGVASARHAGMSWQAIADALGEPRRTVADRFAAVDSAVTSIRRVS